MNRWRPTNLGRKTAKQKLSFYCMEGPSKPAINQALLVHSLHMPPCGYQCANDYLLSFQLLVGKLWCRHTTDRQKLQIVPLLTTSDAWLRLADQLSSCIQPYFLPLISLSLGWQYTCYLQHRISEIKLPLALPLALPLTTTMPPKPATNALITALEPSGHAVHMDEKVKPSYSYEQLRHFFKFTSWDQTVSHLDQKIPP